MLTRLDWKLRRIAAGYRQQDVAARIGVSGTRYSALERGEAEPREWESQAIEKLLPPLSLTGAAEIQRLATEGTSKQEARRAYY